jgi:hypothetical protein
LLRLRGRAQGKRGGEADGQARFHSGLQSLLSRQRSAMIRFALPLICVPYSARRRR